jgi:uncharacterized protein with HEPN domain
MPRDDATPLDINRAAELVLEFAKGMDKAAFQVDPKTQSAVLHQLMILGEAVKRLSSDYRARHMGIPWPLMAGMRDQLIHAYDVVDVDEVWKTVEKDIPELLFLLKPLVSSLKG